MKYEHHESVAAADQYAGLSPEDVELARRFEGKEGKRVVRKVFLNPVVGGKKITHC